MSTLPNYEALSEIEPLETSQMAEVIHMQEYALRQQPAEQLGGIAVTETILNSNYKDMMMVEAARANPALLENLMRGYEWLARTIANKYFITGGSMDDLFQEARFGLYKAVLDYNSMAGMTFKSFAKLCIERQVITAIKTATRRKHGPLNNALSFSHTPAGYDAGSDFTLEDAMPSKEPEIPDIVAGHEIYEDLLDFLSSRLSPLEYATVLMHLDGKAYEELAEELGTGVKVIDNASQRAKRKISEFLHSKGVVINSVKAPSNETTAVDVLSDQDSLDGSNAVESVAALDTPPVALTSLEGQVLSLRREGMSNKAITEELGVEIKSVNDAIQRAKRKTLKEHGKELDWLAFINSPHRRNADPEPIAGLDISPDIFTPLEYRVLKLRREGMSNNAITEELGVSLKSVNDSLNRAKRKLFKDRDGELDWIAFINSVRQKKIDPEPIAGLDISPAVFSSLEYDVLRLRQEGMSYRAVSEELGIKVYTVCNALKRARIKIDSRETANGQ